MRKVKEKETDDVVDRTTTSPAKVEQIELQHDRGELPTPLSQLSPTSQTKSKSNAKSLLQGGRRRHFTNKAVQPVLVQLDVVEDSDDDNGERAVVSRFHTLSPSEDYLVSSGPSNPDPDALPTAYAVDESVMIPGIPAARDVTKEQQISAKSYRAKIGFWKLFAGMVIIAAVIVAAVGIKTGFQSSTDTEDTNDESDHSTAGAGTHVFTPNKSNDTTNTTLPVVEKEEETPFESYCPPKPPIREYTSRSNASRYCHDEYCWEPVGTVLKGELSESFATFIGFDASGKRCVVSSIHAGTCQGEESGIVRVFDITENFDFVQVGQNIEGMNEGEYARGVLSGDGQRLLVGYPRSRGSKGKLNNAGAFAVYQYNASSNTWGKLGDPLYGDTKKSRLGDALGISYSGDIIAVSAPYSFKREGRVYIYKYRNTSEDSTTVWEPMGQTLALEDVESLVMPMFGGQLKLSADGQTIVIGRRNEAEVDRGGISVYRYAGILDTWELFGHIIGISPGDAFGKFVDITEMANGTSFRVAASGKEEYLEILDNIPTSCIRVFDLAKDEDNVTEIWTQVGSTSNLIGEIPGVKLNLISLSQDGMHLATGTERSIAGSSSKGYFKVFAFIEEVNEWKQIGGKIEALQSNGYGARVSISPNGDVLLTSRPEVDYGAVRLYRLVENTSGS